MSWPTMTDYQEAIQNPSFCFADRELRQGTPVLTPLGLPKPISGSFASVYQLNCNGRHYAVRCFLRYHEDQAQRYAAISDTLARARLPYMVTFDLIEEGIRIQNTWYPILKMEWINGLPLHTYIEHHLDDSALLDDLAEGFRTLVADLGRAGIAHGDLQQGNILIVNHAFRLIDYDGMFVPTLRGMDSHEIGHRNYQHPQRTETDFGAHIDDFSAWVIYLSLKALSVQPALWRELNAGDECLLFRHDDFVHLASSPAMRAIEQIDDRDVRALASQFRTLVEGDLSRVPPLTGTETVRGTLVDSVRRRAGSWLDDYLDRRSEPDSLVSESPSAEPDAYEAYGGATWVLDYIDPAPEADAAAANTGDDESLPQHAERYALSAYCMFVYLLLSGLLTGLLTPLTGLAAAGIGAVPLAGFLIVQYVFFPEVQKKRRITLQVWGLRWELLVLTQYVQKFGRDRQRLNQEESARLASLDDAIEEAIEHELAQVALHHASIPGINRLLEIRLRLFGVRSAADVAEDRIVRVPGIDQLRANNLIAWRTEIEQRVRRQQARLLRDWRQSQQAAIQQEYRQQRKAVNAEEAAQHRIIDRKTADLERLQRDLLNYDDVTFVAYLKWIFQ